MPRASARRRSRSGPADRTESVISGADHPCQRRAMGSRAATGAGNVAYVILDASPSSPSSRLPAESGNRSSAPGSGHGPNIRNRRRSSSQPVSRLARTFGRSPVRAVNHQLCSTRCGSPHEELETLAPPRRSPRRVRTVELVPCTGYREQVDRPIGQPVAFLGTRLVDDTDRFLRCPIDEPVDIVATEQVRRCSAVSSSSWRTTSTAPDRNPRRDRLTG